MNDSTPAYGSFVTGRVIPAHEAATTTEGAIAEKPLMPEMQDSLDPNEWVPGVVTADGKFHPNDQSKQPAAGKWVVEFRDFGLALTQLAE